VLKNLTTGVQVVNKIQEMLGLYLMTIILRTPLRSNRVKTCKVDTRIGMKNRKQFPVRKIN
jgi:hypothetical protein